ncbi:hypothetical protein SRHO_G00256050 [Serrasalmus rhombeus]
MHEICPTMASERGRQGRDAPAEHQQGQVSTNRQERDIIRSLKAPEIEIVALQCLGEATGHQEHITALKRKKAALADLLGITAQGALVRSRFRNVTELDAPSKFFFGLERKNGQKRFLHAVRSESGDLVSEPSEIRQQTVSFFSKLFESEWASCRDVEVLPHCRPESRSSLPPCLMLSAPWKSCTRPYTVWKMAGHQGLMVSQWNFTRHFGLYWGQDVLEVLRVSVQEGKLPLSCRRAVLTLLPKKGDLTVLKNWRPVALLCTDCKLLSKALASRLGKVMEQVGIVTRRTVCLVGLSLIMFT